MASLHGGAFTVRHTWFVGGSLLLAAVVLGSSSQFPGPLFTVASVLGSVSFSASLLIFAFGFRRSESVTARRPLRTTALTLLAVWVLLGPVLGGILASSSTEEEFPSALLVHGTIDPYLRFALALVAVLQVGRAGVVLAPWNWVPAWALAALTVPWVLGQIVAAGPSPESEMGTMMVIGALDALIRTTATVVLGVVAIVLADRERRSARDRPEVEISG
jgi:hypothetical protein